MIKQNAKRNARQHKKLKSGPWTQWTWRYKLEGDFPSDESLDELYDMADKCKIWLMITERDGYISLIARNEGELGVGIAFSKIWLREWIGNRKVLCRSVFNEDEVMIE